MAVGHEIRKSWSWECADIPNNVRVVFSKKNGAYQELASVAACHGCELDNAMMAEHIYMRRVASLLDGRLLLTKLTICGRIRYWLLGKGLSQRAYVGFSLWHLDKMADIAEIVTFAWWNGITDGDIIKWSWTGKSHKYLIWFERFIMETEYRNRRCCTENNAVEQWNQQWSQMKRN